MVFYLLFVLELILLFVLSKDLTKQLGRFLFKVTKNERTAIYFMAILFLPGTFIHEVAHFLAALLLLVPVRQMELMPEINEDTVKLGSVPVAKVDFVRNFLVGVAPLIFGTALIVGGLFYAISRGLLGNALVAVLIFYLVFEIGNTMFLSKKDLQGSLVFFLAITFLVAVLYFLGIRVELSENSFLLSEKTISYVRQATIFLLLPIFTDILLIFGLRPYLSRR